jgi:hypothetical protein
VEAVREKGRGVWKGKKKENLANGYCTKAWNEHSPEGPSKGHIMENPMSLILLTFLQRRDFHDLLGQRPFFLFIVLGWDQSVLTT